MSSTERSPETSMGATESVTVRDRAVRLLETGIEDGVLLGGVLVASHGGNISVRCARGAKLPPSSDTSSRPELIDIDTVFDLGGITESLCVASILSRLMAAGKISLNERASRYLQPLGVGQKAQITIGHLLSHTSGFPAGSGVYDELIKANAGPRPGILASSGAKAFAYNHYVRLPLRYDPGTRHHHSDVNYVLLGQIIEIITGLSLEKAFFKYVAAPLQLRAVSFIDLTAMRRRNLEPVVEMFAPLGECSKRERLIAGEVWDETSWVMGGVSGHNGLFGLASDVHSWAVEMLRGWRGESGAFSADSVRALWEPDQPGFKPGWKLGWDASTKEAGFVDSKVSPKAVVSHGSTGCSVFIDPERDVVAVLLTNAGYGGHPHRRFAPWRSEMHVALLETA